MAKWFSKSIHQVVEDVHNSVYVLPVIQRKLVWKIDQMELLFDSIMKENAFGGIMVLECEQNLKPLFNFRPFSIQGEFIKSDESDEIIGSLKYMVIDGQQRLQSLYIGLKGIYGGKKLYFNLLSESGFYEFQFAFAKSELPKDEVDETTRATRNIWYSVPNIYTMFLNNKEKSDAADLVSTTIITSEFILDDFECDQVRNNIANFYKSIFLDQESVGIAAVKLDRDQTDDDLNKEKLVELFTRLNNGGTKLDAFDLVASQLKGYESRMETFFEKMDDFRDLGIDQDNLINLLFILQDIPIKGSNRKITNPLPSDAEFALQNQDKIYNAIYVTRLFLQLIKLEDYVKNTKSVMPLYFIIYHLFHCNNAIDIIKKEGNPNKHNLERWLHLVYLNSVYQSGRRVGWRANTTGIKLSLSCLSKYKNALFPCEELFQVYRGHNLRFLASVDINNLQSLNVDFTFFLLNKNKKYLRANDIDHIQSKNKLEGFGFGYEKINHLANYELLGMEDNRGKKSDRPLKEWIEALGSGKDQWINDNFIPEDPTTWEIENFEKFITQRTLLINQALGKMIRPKLDITPIPNTEVNSVSISTSTVSSRLAINWANKVKFANQSGYGVLFQELIAATENAKMWTTPREKAISFHHNRSMQKIPMTIYLFPDGIDVYLRRDEFPEFYSNCEQFIASMKNKQYIPVSKLPIFIEKIKGLESK